MASQQPGAIEVVVAASCVKEFTYVNTAHMRIPWLAIPELFNIIVRTLLFLSEPTLSRTTAVTYAYSASQSGPIPLPESYMYTSRQQRAICRSPSYWAIAVCCKRLEGVVERENPPGGPIQGGASQSSFISPAQSDLRRQNLRYGSQLSGGDILPALLGSSSVYLAMARLGIRCGFERRMGSLSYVSFR
jgi:hypothetical protein